MTSPDGPHPGVPQAEELPPRRAKAGDEDVATAVRYALLDAADQPRRAFRLVDAATARLQRRRRRHLLAGSLAAGAAVVVASVMLTPPALWGRAQAPSGAATTPSSTATPTDIPATVLTYLTPSEVQAVVPGAESLTQNGEYQWLDVNSIELHGWCGEPVDGVGPLYSAQFADWGLVKPNIGADGVEDTRYPLMFTKVIDNMYIFEDADDAQAYAAAVHQDTVTCAAPTDEQTRDVLEQLDGAAAAISSAGYRDGAYDVSAVAVNGRYVSNMSAQVPGPDTGQGHLEAARGVARLATFAAARAAQAGLP